MNVTDRKLLELAAKAAGYVVLASLAGHADGTTHWWKGAAWGLQIEGIDGIWNPLVDDGDAFRLSVKLGLLICQSAYKPGENAWGFVSTAWYGQQVELESEKFTDDPYAATRRAIVRAAAEIGRTMT